MSGSAWIRRPRRLVIELLLIALTAGLVAGCGGSSRLSHAALVTRADTDCQTANSAVSRLGAPTASLSALTRYAGKVLPISRQLVAKLTVLKPSASDQSKLSRLVSALRNGNRGLAMMARATSTAETNAATNLIVAQSVPGAAGALGAATCAASPSA